VTRRRSGRYPWTPSTERGRAAITLWRAAGVEHAWVATAVPTTLQCRDLGTARNAAVSRLSCAITLWRGGRGSGTRAFTAGHPMVAQLTPSISCRQGWRWTRDGTTAERIRAVR